MSGRISPRQFSEADGAGDPSAVQTVQITIDALVPGEVMPFWRAVLGYEYRRDDTTRPRRGSRPPWPPGAAWSATSTRRVVDPGRRRGQRGGRGTWVDHG